MQGDSPRYVLTVHFTLWWLIWLAIATVINASPALEFNTDTLTKTLDFDLESSNISLEFVWRTNSARLHLSGWIPWSIRFYLLCWANITTTGRLISQESYEYFSLPAKSNVSKTVDVTVTPSVLFDTFNVVHDYQDFILHLYMYSGGKIR